MTTASSCSTQAHARFPRDRKTARQGRQGLAATCQNDWILQFLLFFRSNNASRGVEKVKVGEIRAKFLFFTWGGGSENLSNMSARVLSKNVPYLCSQVSAFRNVKGGNYFWIFSVFYSTLLHLPPLRFHCVGGCWNRTQDSCDVCIGCQTL